MMRRIILHFVHRIQRISLLLCCTLFLHSEVADAAAAATAASIHAKNFSDFLLHNTRMHSFVTVLYALLGNLSIKMSHNIFYPWFLPRMFKLLQGQYTLIFNQMPWLEIWWPILPNKWPIIAYNTVQRAARDHLERKVSLLRPQGQFNNIGYHRKRLLKGPRMSIACLPTIRQH